MYKRKEEGNSRAECHEGIHIRRAMGEGFPAGKERAAIISVEGMTCEMCEHHVENALKKIKGVVEAKACLLYTSASHRYSCRIPSVCRIYYLSFCENSSRSDIGRLDARRHG